MLFWPVPESYNKKIPHSNEPGSFWEEVGDKYNCGVDIYAPEGSQVIAPESGRVIAVEMFTDSRVMSHFNDTKYVIIRTANNLFLKLAAMGNITVKIGDKVEAGDKMGEIKKIVEDDRIYNLIIQNNFFLSSSYQNSYLHIELTRPPIMEFKPYLAGYFQDSTKPYSLINPSEYLASLDMQANNAA